MTRLLLLQPVVTFFCGEGQVFSWKVRNFKRIFNYYVPFFVRPPIFGRNFALVVTVQYLFFRGWCLIRQIFFAIIDNQLLLSIKRRKRHEGFLKMWSFLGSTWIGSGHHVWEKKEGDFVSDKTFWTKEVLHEWGAKRQKYFFLGGPNQCRLLYIYFCLKSITKWVFFFRRNW